MSTSRKTNMMDQFEEIKKVGEGTYGVVFKVRNKKTGDFLALKKIRLDDDDDGVPSTAIREISLLMSLQHPNIVNLQQVFFGTHSLTLAFEFVDYDLKKYMEWKKGLLALEEIKALMYQLLIGIDFCHRRRIMHRDLKPQNLLIDKHGVLKLADFGLARAFRFPFPEYSHEIVTLWYRPPSILLGSRKYTTSVDIWSTGAIMAEMVTKRPLFPGDSEIDQLFRIFRICGTPSPGDWSSLSNYPDYSTKFPKWRPKSWKHLFPRLGLFGKEILRVMMVYDPDKRPSAHLLLQHPYFEDIDANKCYRKSGGYEGQTDEILSPPPLAALAAVQEEITE